MRSLIASFLLGHEQVMLHLAGIFGFCQPVCSLSREIMNVPTNVTSRLTSAESLYLMKL